MQTPFSVFITQTFAHKLFGNEDPLGKTISLKGKFLTQTYTVTGILRDIPETSDFLLRPDLITSTLSPYQAELKESLWNSWKEPYAGTYILLKPGASADALDQKLSDFAKRHLGEEIAQDNSYKLLPLTKLHLYGRQYNQPYATGDIQTCYTLGLIGIFVVAVACINFMNLSTARSARRMREVGMRKVVGAKRSQLTFQFLGESILLSLISLVLSLGLTELTLPMLNGFLGIQLTLQVTILPVLLAIAITVGALSGSYPALFLSSFKPTATLNAARNIQSGHAMIRRGLVTVQFAISIALMSATAIMFQQTEYMRSADLGFDRDVLIEMRGLYGQKTQPEAMKAQFLQHPDVHRATILHFPVGLEPNVDRKLVSADGLDAPVSVHYKLTDHDFLDTHGIPLLSGRNFTPDDFSVRIVGEEGWLTNAKKVLLNETAAKQLRVKIGDHIELGGASREVIGIFKDFHNRSLHDTIRPLMLFHARNELQVFMTLRVSTKNLPNVMEHLNTVWKRFHPDRPSEFVFANDHFNELYQAEQKLSTIFTVSTGLAIAIACLGLLGLIAYTAEVRTKEIGIRKVLGATEVSIVNLLTKEFLLLVALASLLAYPIAYFTMSDWLQNFAYRIDLSPAYFIASTSAALVITLIIIAYQALKAARANPVEALRYE